MVIGQCQRCPHSQPIWTHSFQSHAVRTALGPGPRVLLKHKTTSVDMKAWGRGQPMPRVTSVSISTFQESAQPESGVQTAEGSKRVLFLCHPGHQGSSERPRLRGWASGLRVQRGAALSRQDPLSGLGAGCSLTLWQEATPACRVPPRP